MGPLGFPELIIIFVVALLVFGPRKLPELGRSLGKGLSEFKRASNDLRQTLAIATRHRHELLRHRRSGQDAGGGAGSAEWLDQRCAEDAGDEEPLCQSRCRADAGLAPRVCRLHRHRTEEVDRSGQVVRDYDRIVKGEVPVIRLAAIPRLS